MDAVAVFMGFLVIGWLALLVLSGSAWKVITVAEPKYAEALFTPGLDQAIYHLGPLRWKTLYLKPALPSVRKRVIVLRVAALIQVLVFICFITVLFCGW